MKPSPDIKNANADCYSFQPENDTLKPDNRPISSEHLQPDLIHTKLSNKVVDNDSASNTDINSDSDSSDDDKSEDKCLPYDTCLQQSGGNEIFSIAPAEGNKPQRMLTDPDAEHLSFPALFPKGRFGYTYKRDTKLQHRQYLNARLLNEDTRFATNTDFIFFLSFTPRKIS
jgi:hypothetical protein